ncbi:hypothetical protein N657DRAFT_574910 [Parathielavia appendiculata]|uniref:Gastric mucin-like protein n=1 Tax=Parathielavia appendiculata TaxID=2587402 RepID=A0AAN6TXS7_9PEZI|nr:hypothetical protein N657DRAFT_574910 [Parathielavia appendiculata]
MAVPISPQRAGHIVALEGPSELVSTQLRLLPPSQHLLILPGLQHYLRGASSDTPFNPSELIHRYHTAAQTRHAKALEFLHPSEPATDNRIVFLHGGTMSAQVSCLSAIMEHQTDGDIEEAYATFIRLARNGVAKLSPTTLSYPSTCELSENMEQDEPPEPEGSSEGQGPPDAWAGCMHVADDDIIEDRIIRAMRAADALDKETEFLQPTTPNVDLTVKLVDIPSRSKNRPVPSADGASETLRRSRSADAKASILAEPALHVSPETKPAEEADLTAQRKPPLKIRIPSPPIPWVGEVAAGNVHQLQGRSYEPAFHVTTRTFKPNLSPTRESESDRAHDETSGAGPDSQGESLPQQEAAVDPSEPGIVQATETESEPFESVLPMLEDLVVFYTHATTDDLHDFVVRRLSEVCKTPRLPISVPASPVHDAFQGRSHLILGEDQEVNDTRFEDEHTSGVSPWLGKDLVHGLPTPNHSPTSSDLTSKATPFSTKVFSISMDEETAVSIQNFLRSYMGSQFGLQNQHTSPTNSAEFLSEGGLWRPLKCDGQVVEPDGKPKLDLILAVGAETGVKKERVSEVVGQIEKLGFKTSGDSRSARLHIRFLIANAMQAFTAQPLTKQIQSNPFADRALLAALIIPHLETYLETHSNVRFLLIEYPSEHLPTVLALQTLIGGEMMKVAGIVNSDASTPGQPLNLLDENRLPSEGFRCLNSRESSISGTLVEPCSFSKANFLLASSATGIETTAFLAAIRESLISVSDYYRPERPFYRHPSSQSPLQKAYSSLPIGSNSHSSRKRASDSTSLMITPPSSPTESTLPTRPEPQPRSNHRSIPPRSASITAPSTTTPSRHPHTTHAKSDDAPMDSRIRWGEVNYAAAPSSSSSSSSSPHSVPSRTATASGSSSSHTHTHSRRHQERDPKPLSPTAGEGLEYEDDEDDDDMPDEEMRRLMPLYLRRREDVERMRSTKAFKWLGLA